LDLLCMKIDEFRCSSAVEQLLTEKRGRIDTKLVARIWHLA